MPDTAVLEPGTAEASEAPPQNFNTLELIAPETDTEESPETDAQESPETEGEEAEGAEERTFTAAEVADAEKRGADRVSAEWKKWQTDTEAKAKREAAVAQYQQNEQLADRNRRGYAANTLMAIAKNATENGRDPDPRNVATLANELVTATRHDGHTKIATDLWDAVRTAVPEYRPSAELAQRAADASARYDYPAMAAAQWEMALEAAEQRVAARTQARVEAEAAAAKSTAPKPAQKRTQGPTNITGTSGRRGYANQQELHAAFAEGKVSLAELKRLNGTLPWQ